MPLQTYDTQDAVPEAQRESVIETKDGKFVVAVFEDVAGLKASNAKLKKEKELLAARAAVIGERTPEDVQADLEFAAKAREKQAKDEGNFETLKSQLVQQHNAETEKLAGRGKKLESKLYDVMARREAEAAITAAGGNPKVLLPHVLPFVKPIETDDDWSVKVVDAKGNVRIADAQGAEMSIEQLVETFKQDEAFGIAFAPSGAAGGGARNSGNPGSGGTKVIQVKKGDTAAYKRAAAERDKSGAEIVFVQ